jgi:DNA polymerase III gamma/tau subunit
MAASRVAHAYAFIGPPGSGRKAAALDFAMALLGRDRPEHPDLHVIAPTPPDDKPKGPRAIRIADIRALERAASLRPALGPWKVFILEDAERMTSDAPQAFLKTLEEPPPGTVIILILPRPRAVPATVLSRCQIVRFREARPEFPGADRAAARRMLGDAARGDVEAVFGHTQAVDRQHAEALVDGTWGWYRDLLRVKAEADADPEAAEEARRLPLEEIVRGLGACREAWRALGVNVSPRLTLETMLGRLVDRPA